MVLEKDKVYKIVHNDKNRHWHRWGRKYIICSPINDVEIGEEHISFKTHFTICFDGGIWCDEQSGSGISTANELAKLNDKDIKEIRHAINMLDGKFIYNRKLHKLIINDSNKEE